MKSEIRDGVEFFEDEADHGGEQCARCGSSVYFVDCWECGGEGEVEDDDWQNFEGDMVCCRHCRGTGGWWHCVSGRAWCEAHPMPGREDITSTALKESSEASA